MQNNVLNYLNEIVKKVPQKTAYSDGTVSLTFREVYEQSRSIGSFLCKKGVYKKPVVVFMKKSPQEITAFLGIITGGCFYLPIDEEMPRDRIQLIMNNVKSPFMICDETTIEIARTFCSQGQEIVLYENAAKEWIDDQALKGIYEKSIDTDPIYVVFTSGSTGIPKGVTACHRSVIDYVEQLSKILDFSKDTIFGNQSPLYFDACLKEIYPALKFGATDYLIPKNLFSAPTRLIEYLNTYRINTICWVVSALTMVSAFGTFETVCPEYLHTVAFGSEVFPVKQLNIWRKALPDASFTNLYGPTEGTGMCCYYKIEREFEEQEVIPIGRPFPNCEILLLEKDGSQVPFGEEGEICIRGTAVTLGYYNNPSDTQKAFVQNPLNKAYPEVIYRTGDIGRYNEAGELIFVSRRDYQIKHMGYRVELGEIENSANRIKDIRHCACIYDNERSKIILFYTGGCTEKDLLVELRKKLPSYMIPNKVIHLENMQFTANGKVDRVSLKSKYLK